MTCVVTTTGTVNFHCKPWLPLLCLLLHPRDQTSTHLFVQTVCILRTVCQPLCECVAAGVTQCCVFPALQTSLSQQNGPDLTHRLTPLLLPGEKQTCLLDKWPQETLHDLQRNRKRHMCPPTLSTHLLFSLVGESLCEFVEGSRIFSLDVASTSEKLREVWELLLFHLYLRV